MSAWDDYEHDSLVRFHPYKKARIKNMANNKSYTITGQIYWAKIFGDPQPGYDEEKKEWSFDFVPDAAGVVTIKKLGLGEKFKNKGDARGDFLAFKRPEMNRMKGSPNSPIPVVDVKDETWPDNTPLGNGTKAQVTFGIAEWPTKGKIKAGMKPVPYEIKVLDLVEYQRSSKPDANAEESYANG